MRQVHIIHVKKCASAKHDKDRHWSDLRELASTSLPIRTPPMLAPSSLALFGICILVIIVSIFASEENDSNPTPN